MPADMKRPGRGETSTNEAVRIGEELRETREAHGLTLDDVASSLRIRRVYLAALEEGRVRELPAMAYAVGFVRNYARALGLEEESLVRRFRESGAVAAPRRADLVFPEPVPERGAPAGAVILVGAVLAVAGYVGWYQWSEGGGRAVDVVPPVPPRLERLAEPTRPPVVAEAPAVTAPPLLVPPVVAAPVLGPPMPGSPVPGPPVLGPPVLGLPVLGPPAPGPALSPPAAAVAPAAPAGEAGSRILVRARAEAWVQVRERNAGPILFNRVLKPGETYAVPAREGLTLTTGNAPGLELVVDGQTAPAFPAGIAVRRDIGLDPERIRSGAAMVAPPPTPRPPAGAAPARDPAG